MNSLFLPLRNSLFLPLRRRVSSIIGKHPTIFYSTYRVVDRRNSHLAVNPNTELVIEGFPRSANTYSVLAFECMQSAKVNIAHHLHVPAQVLRGIKYGIPIILLIRNPKDVCISSIIHNPNLTIEHILRDYIDYYTFLYDYKSACVIAHFEEVINNYDHIIDKTNLKFGTNFTSRKISIEEEKLISDSIKKLNQRLERGEEHRMAYPSKAKTMLKQNMTERIESKKYRELVKKSEAVYQRYLD